MTLRTGTTAWPWGGASSQQADRTGRSLRPDQRTTGGHGLLFDCLVGTREHCGCNFEAERLGGLHIDDES